MGKKINLIIKENIATIKFTDPENLNLYIIILYHRFWYYLYWTMANRR